jgi:hypothetical protein
MCQGHLPRNHVCCFKVEVLKILWRIALYSTIDRSETSNTIKINKIEHQTKDNQQYDAISR